MPIAFDAAVGAANTGATVTVALTTAGNNRILWVCASTDLNDTITGVTYAGVAMTKVGSSVQNSGNSAWASLWYLVSPALGANNVVATHSDAARTVAVAAASYTGVRQTNIPDANGSATTQAVSVTTIAENCWVVMASQVNTTPITAGASTTLRVEGTGWGNGIYDNNAAKTPPGAVTLNIGNGTAWASVIASFAPATPSMLAVF